MAERNDWLTLAKQFRALADRAPDMFAADITPKEWTLIGGTDVDHEVFDRLSLQGAAGLDADTLGALQGSRGRQMWLDRLATDPLMPGAVETARTYTYVRNDPDQPKPVLRVSGRPGDLGTKSDDRTPGGKIDRGPIRQIWRVCEVCAEYCENVAMTPRRVTKLEALRRAADMKVEVLVALMYPGGKVSPSGRLSNKTNVEDHLHGRRSMQTGTASQYARVFSKALERKIMPADVIGYVE